MGPACSQIGEVTGDGMLQFLYGMETWKQNYLQWNLVLGGGAPQYERELQGTGIFEKIDAFDFDKIPVPEDLKAVAEQLISFRILQVNVGFMINTIVW